MVNVTEIPTAAYDVPKAITENAAKVLSGEQSGSITRFDLIPIEDGFDFQTFKRLLTDPQMEHVWSQCKKMELSDNQIVLLFNLALLTNIDYKNWRYTGGDSIRKNQAQELTEHIHSTSSELLEYLEKFNNVWPRSMRNKDYDLVTSEAIAMLSDLSVKAQNFKAEIPNHVKVSDIKKHKKLKSYVAYIHYFLGKLDHTAKENSILTFEDNIFYIHGQAADIYILTAVYDLHGYLNLDIIDDFLGLLVKKKFPRSTPEVCEMFHKRQRAFAIGNASSFTFVSAGISSQKNEHPALDYANAFVKALDDKKFPLNNKRGMAVMLATIANVVLDHIGGGLSEADFRRILKRNISDSKIK